MWWKATINHSVFPFCTLMQTCHRVYIHFLGGMTCFPLVTHFCLIDHWYVVIKFGLAKRTGAWVSAAERPWSGAQACLHEIPPRETTNLNLHGANLTQHFQLKLRFCVLWRWETFFTCVCMHIGFTSWCIYYKINTDVKRNVGKVRY